MKKILRWILLGCAAVLVLNIVVLAYDAHLPPDQAAFAAVSLLVQGEPMHLNPGDLSIFGKTTVALLLIAGTALLILLFGIVTDRLLALRLEYMLGKRGIPVLSNHIILVGLGQVGYRTWQALKKFDPNATVCVIEPDEENAALDEVRAAGGTVIVDDGRKDGVLEKAYVSNADSVICATDDDLANLDIALIAREQNPEIRVVLRMYDQRLARRVQDGFNIQVAFSSSALAAPAFAAAAFDRSIINSYYLGSYQVVTARVIIGEGAELIGHTIHGVERDHNCAILKHIQHDGESHIYPTDDLLIGAHDHLMVSSDYPTLQKLKQLANDTRT